MVGGPVPEPRDGNRWHIVRRTLKDLVFATFLAPCLRPLYNNVTESVGDKLRRPTRLVTGESFDQLRTGDVDFAFLCGYPYVRLRSENMPSLQAIAAPVVQGDRYEDRPIYFSDVIVAANSPVKSFEDLRGCTWAFNDRDSHSGYLVTLHRLVEMGESAAFFGSWEQAGFHQRSIRMVADGTVDASAIDSHVLAIELREHPELASQIKVIDQLGPSTIQPLVATGAVETPLRETVKEVVAALGHEQLEYGLVDRFAAVEDSSYDDIRAMFKAVRSAGLAAGS